MHQKLNIWLINITLGIQYDLKHPLIHSAGHSIHALKHALAHAAGHSMHAWQHPLAHSARAPQHAAGHLTQALQHPLVHSARPSTHAPGHSTHALQHCTRPSTQAAGHPIHASTQFLQSLHVQQQHSFWYAWQHFLQWLQVNVTRSFLLSHLRHEQQQHHAQQHSSSAPNPAPTYAPIAPGVVNGDVVGTATWSEITRLLTSHYNEMWVCTKVLHVSPGPPIVSWVVLVTVHSAPHLLQHN